VKVLVLGAGVVGLATAYYLWKDGHEVVVVDRQSGPGQETSYGNAGGLCPSFAGPWAAPGMLTKVLGMSLQADSPIRFSLIPNWQRMGWVLQWMRNCNPEKFRINKLRMQRVAHYSYACLKELSAEAPITDFDFCQGGVLQIFRTSSELDVGRLSAKALQEYGVTCQLLSTDEALAAEPALAKTKVPIAGALHLPLDASGDSFKFANQLAAFLEARGVKFKYNTLVTAILTEGDGVSAVMTAQGPLTASAYVVALGNYAPLLVAPLGIRLPVYPLKGYSITMPVRDRDATTQTAIMDEHNKVMISRLGNRIRAAGMAELTGYSTDLKLDRRALLIKVVKELFPQGLDFDDVAFWAGLRPMTPDGPPILGKTRWRNLLLNSGHGSNGWTQSCGTGKIVADMLHGRQPAIDTEGLTLARFGG
jgi:D-amino-acid dehydrogenase